ncbi:MAG: hypothetical protein V1806_04980 [Pseudomonadota bacterium]
MSGEDPAVALEQLRGQMDTRMTALEGLIQNLQTAVRMGAQAVERQVAGFMAALGHQDGECTTCRHGLDRQLSDHEARLRVLEAAKWKLAGALLIAGPLWGAICGALATKFFGVGK